MRNHAPKYATDKQKAFIDSLLNDRTVDPDLAHEAEETRDIGTSRAASQIIEWLLAQPRKPGNRPDEGRRVGQEHRDGPQLDRFDPAGDPPVAEGRYALPADYDPEGTPVFYKVDCPTEGKWAGYVFLRQLIGPNESPVRDREARNSILGQIAENPIDALRRYGTLSNHCGRCGLELTDKFSRFIGVGPVCREALGLDKSEAEYVRKGGVLPESYLREVAVEEARALREAEGRSAQAVEAEDARIRMNEARDEDYVHGDADGVLDHEAVEHAQRLDRAAAARREAQRRQDAGEAPRADGRWGSTTDGDLRALAARFQDPLIAEGEARRDAAETWLRNHPEAS